VKKLKKNVIKKRVLYKTLELTPVFYLDIYMVYACLLSSTACTPSYASVLALGENQEVLQEEIRQLEKHLLPTITGWCQHCQKPCLITRDLPLFKAVSEHHVHQIITAKMLMGLDLMGDN
jgi:hypothetical protein